MLLLPFAIALGGAALLAGSVPLLYLSLGLMLVAALHDALL